MEEIKEKITGIIKEKYGIDANVNVSMAPKNTGADFATNAAMTICKRAGKAPMEAAGEIADEFNKQNKDFMAEAVKPGFLNFKSSDDFFTRELSKLESDFSKTIANVKYAGQTVICEFSDPNPFKVLHVGHLYTSIVGDSISRLIEFAGGNVVRANFGGDVGLHVAKNLYTMKDRTPEINENMSPSEKAEFMASCYVAGTNAYEEDEAAHEEITKLNKKIYEIANEGEDAVNQALEKYGCNTSDAVFAGLPDDLKIAKLYWWGRTASYNYFDDFYDKVGVKFDKYYPESTVAGRGLKEVKAHTGDVYEISDGATVFKGEKYGLHTRVFINHNGLPTYEAKDTGLIFTKFDDYHFDKSIVITGNDIIDYMKVVLTAVKQYAPELVERTIHLTHGNVRLPGNEKMSSRKGNFIKAADVLSDVSHELAQARGEDEADKKISLGAVKYAFLKYKIGGNIIFDAKESVSMTGNSGPYLQYSAVRASKILGKLMKNGVKDPRDDYEMTEHEKALAKKIIEYKDVLSNAVDEFSPHLVCTYLYELAQEFSRFYETTPVAGSDFEYERGKIVLCYLKVLTHGLTLLGIEVPEQM